MRKITFHLNKRRKTENKFKWQNVFKLPLLSFKRRIGLEKTNYKFTSSAQQTHWRVPRHCCKMMTFIKSAIEKVLLLAVPFHHPSVHLPTGGRVRRKPARIMEAVINFISGVFLATTVDIVFHPPDHHRQHWLLVLNSSSLRACR